GSGVARPGPEEFTLEPDRQAPPLLGKPGDPEHAYRLLVTPRRESEPRAGERCRAYALSVVRGTEAVAADGPWGVVPGRRKALATFRDRPPEFRRGVARSRASLLGRDKCWGSGRGPWRRRAGR